MGSIAGKEGNPTLMPYSASKAAVIALTKSLAKELAGKGNITVNAISPAVIRTAILDGVAPGTVEYMISKIPHGPNRHDRGGRRADPLPRQPGGEFHDRPVLRYQRRPGHLLIDPDPTIEHVHAGRSATEAETLSSPPDDDLDGTTHA